MGKIFVLRTGRALLLATEERGKGGQKYRENQQEWWHTYGSRAQWGSSHQSRGPADLFLGTAENGEVYPSLSGFLP